MLGCVFNTPDYLKHGDGGSPVVKGLDNPFKRFILRILQVCPCNE